MDYLFATILLVFFFHGASSDEVVIDQQPQETWAWTPMKPKIQMPIGKFASGWGHPTLRGRAYSVCDVDVDKEPNNWLYSGYINVEEAQKVDITVTYHMSNPCNDGKKCKTFKVVFYGYVMESDTSVDVARMPNPLTNRSLYRNISSFNLRTPWTKTTVIIPLSVKTKYIVFAFHDQGACAYLYSVKVSYNVCGKRNLVQRLVSLPRTIAPVNESLLVEGTCAPNSLQEGRLIVACDRYGEWNSRGFEGRCVCEEGQENNKGICTDCPSGKYVDQKGNNCTGLPSAPQSAGVTFVNETTVEILWQPPAVTGESTRVFYEVVCHKACSIDSNNCVEEGCGSGSGIFIPSAEVNKTRVIATNLSPYVNYAFKIYTRNRVSKLAKDKYGVEGNFSKITVRTLGTIPGKPDVSVEQLEDTVKVSWTLKRKNGAIMGYHVIYIRDDDPTDRTNLTTKNMTQSFEDLTAGKTYEFQVYAVNNFGKGPKGVKKFTIPKVSAGSSSTSQFFYIATSIVLGIILLIVLTVLGVYCYCQRKPRHRPMQRLGNLQDTQENLPLEAENIHMHHILPEINTDEAENDALYTDVCETHTFELERKDIILERLLGSGNFGEVHKAIIGNNTVAVKSLKENATPKDKEDMITELNVMESLRPHPHVVKLIGCCSLRDPLLIVLEYLPYGDLLGYLRKSRGHADVYNSGEKTPTSSLSANDLLSFAWMIADGMEYLAKMKIVHRDLAARNILVGENKICKISDFGLARDISADIYVRTSQARLPVKWMPPESFFLGESSTMSDVWSYGIVLWEVFTIGDSPYPRVKGENMAALLERGYRMPRPMHISEELYAIMSECWSEKPEERPSFHWICAAVKRLIDDEKIYINLDYYNDEDYVNFDMIEGLQ